MTGVGTAGGAATIINAFATGKGAAFGLQERVTARVTPARAYSVWNGQRRLPPSEALLATETARLVQRAVAERTESVRIDVRSPIPAKRGLKSSSAVSVAVARAVLDHLHEELDARRLLSIVADAGLKSKTSLTGAYDDAAACLLGGVAFTDNLEQRLLRVDVLPSSLVALVRVPAQTSATGDLKRKDFLPLRDLVEEAWRLALKGNYKDAMLVNTLAYAPVLHVHPRFTLRAIERGAFAAGLSGKGPAEVALVHPDILHRFRDERDVRVVELNAGGPPA